MNNRIEINIAVISNCSSDQSALANLLFGKDTKRTKEDFLTEPVEVYMEIDMSNFPNSSKLCIKECAKHNNLILCQKDICKKPIFFNCVKRIPNLINYDLSSEPKMNKNILLTFYFLGNNYKNFNDEFAKANIIIYIGNKYTELFSDVSNSAQSSGCKKHFLTIINDNQHSSDHLESSIRVSLPFDYSDYCVNKDQYLKEDGFVTFKRNLASILNHQYKNMIDENIQLELNKMKAFAKTDPNCFIIDAEKMKIKITKIEKIFKKSYQSIFDSIIKDFINEIGDFELEGKYILDKLKYMYKNDAIMSDYILRANDILREKIICSITNNLYCNEITADTFLPSNVHKYFDKLDDLDLEPDKVKKLSVHICELYTTKAKQLLDSENNIELLYNSYFDETQNMKMLSMLNEVISKIDFTDLKKYFIQIIITKLMIVEKCIRTKNVIESQIINNIIIYLKSLRYFITENKHKKYNYLFGTINDICTNFIHKIDDQTQLQYLSDNISLIINFVPDSIIKLEKFIIKTIKKNSYRDLIAVDQFDSDEDSDIDIYANTPFDFSKDDYSSEGESVNGIDLVEI